MKPEIFVVSTYYNNKSHSKPPLKEFRMAYTEEKANVLFNLAVRGATEHVANLKKVASVRLYKPMIHIDGEIKFDIPEKNLRHETIEGKG